MSGMTESACQKKIDAQCRGARAFDSDEALQLLDKARVYVSRNASIGAQQLAEKINQFVASKGTPST